MALERQRASDRAGQLALASGPTIVLVAALVLSLAPLGLALGVRILPALPLMAVYFWAVRRPAYMPAIAVLLVGLAQDLISGGPVGLWSATYLGTYALVVSQRMLFIGSGPAGDIIGFALAALFSGLTSWTLASLYYASVLNPGPIVFDFALSVLIYPLFGRLFAWIDRQLIAAG